MPGGGLAVDRATGNGRGAAGTHVEGHVAGIERLARRWSASPGLILAPIRMKNPGRPAMRRARAPP
jgi:hypothetical protein